MKFLKIYFSRKVKPNKNLAGNILVELSDLSKIEKNVITL